MRIFLDSGHNASGADTGAQGNGLKEQDITYEIAQKVGDRLRNYADIKHSRGTIVSNVGTTVSESINGRVNMANSWGADLFVSIHCNAATPSANGTETLIYSHRSSAAVLANIINSNLVGLGFTNRGVKERKDLGVLKGTNMPSILIEVGFISNARDALILRDRQDEIAQAIVNGILEYMGVETMTAEQAIDKIISKGVNIDKSFWLTACEHVKYLSELFIKIANIM